MTYFTGRVLAVNEERLGDFLSVDAPIGSTSLTVDDTVDFAEEGGSLRLGSEVIAYTAVNATASTVSLVTPTTVAAVVGDAVELWDPTTSSVVTDFVAQVEEDGEEGSGDPLHATVSHSLIPLLPVGIRDPGAGESVDLEFRGEDLFVVNVRATRPTVASEFVAEELSGKTVTGGKFRTGPSGQSRVEISDELIDGGLDPDFTVGTVRFYSLDQQQATLWFNEAADQVVLALETATAGQPPPASLSLTLPDVVTGGAGAFLTARNPDSGVSSYLRLSNDGSVTVTSQPNADVNINSPGTGNVNVNGASLTGQWSTYTPTWTASTTNPVLNNGTLVGRYQQIGKTVRFSLVLTFGTTTTAGTGTYTFSLPVASRAGNNQPLAGTGRIPGGLIRFPVATSTTTFVINDVAGASVGSTTVAWAAPNVISIQGSYEAA